MNQTEYQASRYQHAQFLTAAHEWHQLPPDHGCEVAFAGRSNVGKSSVINRLCRQTRLARTSRTPGRTQQIVFFDLGTSTAGDPMRLTDLPGYGYAKVPEALRRHWGGLMARYFRERRSLAGLVIIMDIRHPLSPHDCTMLDWGEQGRVPCHVLLNKTDKLSRGAANQALHQVRAQLPDTMTLQLYSASKGEGMEELMETLEHWYAALPPVTADA